MRRLLLAALFCSATPAFAAQRDFPVSGFDRIDLSAAGRVDVRTGSRFAVQADGDPELLALLNVHVEQGTLVIGWTRRNVSTNGRSPIRFRIAMPRIGGAILSGAGTIRVDRVESPDFAAAIRGAGTIDLPALRTDRARFDMGGAGKITASGTAGSVDAQVHGFGAIEIAGLNARSGRFAMGGTGSIKARVDGPADASMSGMGSIDIAGHPRCTIHKSGLGSVNCGG